MTWLLGFGSIDFIDYIEGDFPPLDNHKMSSCFGMETGHRSSRRLEISSMTVDDQDISKTSSDEVF